MLQIPDFYNVHWKALLRDAVSDPCELPGHLMPEDAGAAQRVASVYPMRINPYYLSLMRHCQDPIWKQAVPDPVELMDHDWLPDPLAEKEQSPVANLIHRYPDRVVFLISNNCAVYCRHCMRKRRVGTANESAVADFSEGVEYIRKHPQIRDVILSGGDPLLLDDGRLEHLLAQLKGIHHVEMIRIHTRVLCTLPQRITPELVKILKSVRPLYVITHFNHPSEITPLSASACDLLADSGIVLGCQNVLLKGVNDNPETMKRLMQKLLTIRVRPYYLHHPDLVRGTRHFQPSLESGLDIMAALRGHTSGLCVPQYVVDLPGGGGKVPLLPESVLQKEKKFWIIRNHEGRKFRYPVS